MNRNNKLYLSIIIFIIPLIVLPIIILTVKIPTSDLKNIISSDNDLSECYNLTYSFIYNQKSDENYSSLHSYLKSFISVCIVIIIIYFLKIIYTPCFAFNLAEDMDYGYNLMLLLYGDFPARIISFIPVIVCVILLRIRSYTKNCEVFMDYYNLCSSYYGDSFKNTFSNIMNIRTYTLSVVILSALEFIYHTIIFFAIFFQKEKNSI